MILSGVLLLSEKDFYYTTVNHVVLKSNIDTSFVLIAFIFSIIVYLYIPSKINNKKQGANIFKPSIKYYLIIYIVGMLFVFIGSGLLEGGNWYQNRHHFFKSSGAIAVLVAFIINSAKVLVISSIVYKWIKGELNFFKFLFFVVSFAFLDMFFSGNRIYLFCTAIIIGLLLFKKYPKKTLISFPILVPSVFVLGYFASIFRHMRGPLFAEGLPTWNIFVESLKRAMLLEPPNFTYFFIGISESVNVNVMYDLFRGYNDFLYGATYLKPFVFYLPRSIWENKPQSITVLAADYLGGASLVTTVIGEMYMNFYLFGIIILPILLWYTDVLLTNALKSYGLMSNIVMFFFGILIFRMPFSDEFLVFVFLVIILKAFHYFKKFRFVIKSV
ncbi:O-antigen polymerase [Flaviramulus multivorans]|nr:O-antigen polymerase [Flaviramulus multivorans]